MSRRTFGALTGAALVTGPVRAARAQSRTLRFGTIWTPTGIWADGVNEFAAAVKNRTNGALEIKVFPSSQLGNERELLEGLQLGNLDFTFGGPGVLTNFDPKIGIFDMPFMFRDYVQANKVMDGSIGKEIWESMRAKAGIRILASGAQGFRYVLTSKKSIKALDDMKGFLPFKSYRVVDTALVRVIRDEQVQARVLGPSGDNAVLILRFSSGGADGKKLYVNTFNLNDDKSGRLLQTAFSMDVGESIVVGTSSVSGSDEALVTILTAVP